MMGGLINGSTVQGDLWMVQNGNGNLPCKPIPTVSEGPGPRVGHASLLVGNAFIIFGGDTKMEDSDDLDDTLYLLNTSKSFCVTASRAPVNPDSFTAMVSSNSAWRQTRGKIWPLTEHSWIANIHLWRTGGWILF